MLIIIYEYIIHNLSIFLAKLLSSLDCNFNKLPIFLEYLRSLLNTQRDRYTLAVFNDQSSARRVSCPQSCLKHKKQKEKQQNQRLFRVSCEAL